MKKTILAATVAAAAFALPTAVQAQEAKGTSFIGVSAGIHSLGLEDEFNEIDPTLDLDDSSPIIGVFVGYDQPVSSNLFLGFEGNYHFGTDALDADYGASVRFGFNAAGGTKAYVRGGYQAIKVDYNEIINDDSFDFSGIDDTESDYLVGVGVDVPLGGAFVRANVDTISFDTLRATAGVGLRF